MGFLPGVDVLQLDESFVHETQAPKLRNSHQGVPLVLRGHSTGVRRPRLDGIRSCEDGHSRQYKQTGKAQNGTKSFQLCNVAFSSI